MDIRGFGFYLSTEVCVHHFYPAIFLKFTRKKFEIERIITI